MHAFFCLTISLLVGKHFAAELTAHEASHACSSVTDVPDVNPTSASKISSPIQNQPISLNLDSAVPSSESNDIQKEHSELEESRFPLSPSFSNQHTNPSLNSHAEHVSIVIHEKPRALERQGLHISESTYHDHPQVHYDGSDEVDASAVFMGVCFCSFATIFLVFTIFRVALHSLEK